MKQILLKLVRRILLFLIYLYQSGAYLLGGKHCKYVPSCSAYAIEALTKYGIFHACCLIAKRLSRCHPFTNQGGYDPLPQNE